MANKMLIFLIASLTVVHSIAFAEGDATVAAKKNMCEIKFGRAR